MAIRASIIDISFMMSLRDTASVVWRNSSRSFSNSRPSAMKGGTALFSCITRRRSAFSGSSSGGSGLPAPGRLSKSPLRSASAILAVAGVPDGAPVRFLWRRVFYHVAIAEGPERIAPEWWREEAGHTCDYFRVEDREGRRFWLFRKGLFAGESQPPQWFLHGFFG